MRRRILLFPIVAAMLVFNSGCAVNRATATVAPEGRAQLGQAKTFYVVRGAKDERGIERLIAENLTKRGFKASSGAESTPPAGTDAVVTYADKWMWDITMYMIELTVVVRNPDGSFPMASGNSLHTSLTRKSPQEMVDEVMANIFSEASKKADAAQKAEAAK